MRTERYKKARKGAWVGILGNIFLGVFKLVVGIVGSSSALIADAFHSISDAASSVVVLYGLKFAVKPADKEHPYGHGRAESLAAGTVASIIIILAVILCWNAVSSMFQKGGFKGPATIALWIAIFSVITKEWMFQYSFNLGKQLNSTSLIADAWHHRSDAFSSVVAAVGIGGAILGGERFHFLDNVAAVIIAVMIAIVGVKIFRSASDELMDTMPSPEVIDKIKSKAKEISKVRDIEKVLVRKSGLDYLVDIHVEVDEKMTVKESHEIAKKVKDKIIAEIPEVKSVLVHIEPYYPGDH